jgi:hypothetical protein
MHILDFDAGHGEIGGETDSEEGDDEVVDLGVLQPTFPCFTEGRASCAGDDLFYV